MKQLEKIFDKLIVQGDCKIDVIIESLKNSCTKEYYEENIPTIKQYIQESLDRVFADIYSFNIISADNARKEALSVKNHNTYEKLKDINLHIKDAIRNGYTSVSYNGGISHSVKKVLEDAGYIITTYNGRNELTTTISFGGL